MYITQNPNLDTALRTIIVQIHLHPKTMSPPYSKSLFPFESVLMKPFNI